MANDWSNILRDRSGGSFYLTKLNGNLAEQLANRVTFVNHIIQQLLLKITVLVYSWREIACYTPLIPNSMSRSDALSLFRCIILC